MNRSAEVFNHDVETKDGYLYALDRKLSSRLATGPTGRSVTDIGCGDGTFRLRAVYVFQARRS